MSDRESTQQKMGHPTTDSETSDAPPRSRSQSRRSRRRKQQQKSQKQSMPALDEKAESESTDAQVKAMQPFERIGPAETSMDGPVTHARAQRGEIPMRSGDPNQGLKTGKGDSTEGESEMMKQDGLKLRLELNLDIELELKASIRGDITLALLN